MEKFSLSRQFFKDVWLLTRSYWLSEKKKKAFLLLFCIVALTLGIVYMLVQLNHWNRSFYNALQQYQTEKIFDELVHFSWLAAVYIIMAVYSYYLQQMLVLNWRRWLTRDYIDAWLENKTYYNLQMFGQDTDNPDQRISEDVRLFVEMTLNFFVGILKAFCTFASFVVILYELSGALTFTFLGRQWTVDGYLFWASFVYSIAGTYVTHLVGRKLVQLNFVQQRFEADFRFSMIRLRESAESVAFYKGEKQEGDVFKHRFSLLLENFQRLIDKRKQLVWINSGYAQLAIIFPFVAAMNSYLAKNITLGGLIQVAGAFGRVQDSLSYFVDTYAGLAEWQSVVVRLTNFKKHMETVAAAAEGFSSERGFSERTVLAKQLNIALPDGRPLLERLSFELMPGTNVLVQGTSGSGKSTLLRAMAGIWPFVDGELALPPAHRLMFIPQRTYIPLGTLREALLYPGTQKPDDAELLDVMELCHIGYLAEHLDEVADWSHVLSVGEQQRLAFVRAHVQKPQWLFLDEATSALDEATEADIYEQLAKRLPQTTLVSVGHRSTLKIYHKLSLYIDRDIRSITLLPLATA